jgi:hypothetical protein
MINKSCPRCGRAVLAGALLCLACIGPGAVPATGHTSTSAHQVAVTRQVPMRPGLPGDRPEGWHLPEPDYTVHHAGTAREAGPGSSGAAPSWVQAAHRKSSRLDPRLLRRVMGGTRVSQLVPPAAPFVPQMVRRPRPDPRILSRRVSRGSANPVGVSAAR